MNLNSTRPDMPLILCPTIVGKGFFVCAEGLMRRRA